jgi:hypothetical protein
MAPGSGPFGAKFIAGPCGSGSEKGGGGEEDRPNLAAWVGRGNSEVGPQVLSQLSPRLLVMHDDGPERYQSLLIIFSVVDPE